MMGSDGLGEGELNSWSLQLSSFVDEPQIMSPLLYACVITDRN